LPELVHVKAARFPHLSLVVWYTLIWGRDLKVLEEILKSLEVVKLELFLQA
jgi:hypothetical protein